MSLPRPSGLPRRISKKWWAWRKLPGRFHVRKPASFWVWRKWRAHRNDPQPAPPPKPVTVFMYDDVNVNLIPRNAKAAAGYIDGHWQTYLKLKLRCPLAKLVSIAVFPSDNADVLDVEPGDATNAQAPAWVKRQNWRRKNGHKYGTALPVLYTSASNGPHLIAVCTKAGLRYGIDYLWWSAHYDPKWGVHFCHPGCYPGVDHVAHATQYTDHANNEKLDESVCSPEFFA